MKFCKSLFGFFFYLVKGKRELQKLFRLLKYLVVRKMILYDKSLQKIKLNGQISEIENNFFIILDSHRLEQ